MMTVTVRDLLKWINKFKLLPVKMQIDKVVEDFHLLKGTNEPKFLSLRKIEDLARKAFIEKGIQELETVEI